MTNVTIYNVKASVYGHGPGWCFTSHDLSNAGGDVAVRQALSRLKKGGFIRRIAWGLYDYPRKHPTLGTLPPDLDQAVKAIARRDRITVMPSGAHAANALGLSEQVPGKLVYLTDGPARRVRIGNTEIILKRTTPRMMAMAGTPAGLVVAAFKYLGKDHVDHSVATTLRKALSRDAKGSLRKNVTFAPRWMYKSLMSIAGSPIRG